MYTATFQIGDKEFKTSGKTVSEAFDKFKLDKYPKQIGVLTVEHGDKKIQKVLNIVKIKRFALNPISRGIWAKLLQTAL